MKKIKSWTELAWKDTLEKQDSKENYGQYVCLYSSGFFWQTCWLIVCVGPIKNQLCHVMINAITYFGGWYDADGVSQIMLFSLHHQESFTWKNCHSDLSMRFFVVKSVEKESELAGSLLCCQCISLSTFLFSLKKKNYRDKVGDPSGWSHPYELNVVL